MSWIDGQPKTKWKMAAVPGMESKCQSKTSHDFIYDVRKFWRIVYRTTGTSYSAAAMHDMHIFGYFLTCKKNVIYEHRTLRKRHWVFSIMTKIERKFWEQIMRNTGTIAGPENFFFFSSSSSGTAVTACWMRCWTRLFLNGDGNYTVDVVHGKYMVW